MTSSATLAETICHILRERGVKRLFGIPGGGSSLDLIEAASGAGLDFVLTRTEAAGAIMAAVSGELTGVAGVMLVGVGPGAASAVNGVAYGSLERAPMLLFTDGPASSLHQAFDQQALFRPVSKLQRRLLPEHGGAQMAGLLDAAEALPRGPVHIELTAADAQAAVFGDPPLPPDRPAARFGADDLSAARALLAASRKPLIVAGMEARYHGAEATLGALARALAAPVLLTYKAKGCLADDDPLMAGLFTNAAAEAEILGRADTILLYGLDPVEMIPGPWRAEAPVLDLFPGPKPAGPMAVAARLTGPLAEAVAELSKDCAPSLWRAPEIAALKAGLRARAAIGGDGHTAESVIMALAAAAPAGCRLTVDAGAHMLAAMALWPAARPNDVLKSNGLSTMGYALPAAIASALETPARPVAAFTGDGGLMMCLAELTTAVERGLDIVAVVCNDAALSLIDIKQQRQQRPTRGVRYPAVDLAAAAEALGCRAWRVEPGAPLAPVLEAAFAAPGPALVDVRIDASGYGEQLAALRG